VHDVFVLGLIIGFALAAPVGPIAALCVQRTMSQGRAAGLISGAGAAIADAIYGTLAAFGATFISDFLVEHRMWLQRAGGGVLVILGIRLFLTRPNRGGEGADGKSLVGDFVSTLLLTLTNPMTFLAFAAIFAMMGLGAVRGHSLLTFELVAGVTAGSAAWWAILVLGIYAIRRHFSYDKLVWVNRAAGIFVVGVGILYIFVLRGEPVEPRFRRTLQRIAATAPLAHSAESTEPPPAFPGQLARRRSTARGLPMTES
jgi:threonine/homoserine/homoserine lactone efflux protein